MENLEEMDKFLETCKIPKLISEEIKSLNRTVMSKEIKTLNRPTKSNNIESVNKNLPT